MHPSAFSMWSLKHTLKSNKIIPCLSSPSRCHGLLLGLISKEHSHATSHLILHSHSRAAIGQAQHRLPRWGEDRVPGVQGVTLVGTDLDDLDLGLAANLPEPPLVVVVLGFDGKKSGRSRHQNPWNSMDKCAKRLTMRGTRKHLWASDLSINTLHTALQPSGIAMGTPLVRATPFDHTCDP